MERLYEEVIAEYGDIPYLTTRHRMMEALLKEPAPTWNNKLLSAQEIKQLKGKASLNGFRDGAHCYLSRALNALERRFGFVCFDDRHSATSGMPESFN